MFIRDIFAQKKPVLSFEVFPPKKDSGLDNVISAVDELSKMPKIGRASCRERV